MLYKTTQWSILIKWFARQKCKRAHVLRSIDQRSGGMVRRPLLASAMQRALLLAASFAPVKENYTLSLKLA